MTVETTKTLRVCPFCYEDAELLEYEYRHQRCGCVAPYFHVCCTGKTCRVQPITEDCDTAEEAIAIWNAESTDAL